MTILRIKIAVKIVDRIVEILPSLGRQDLVGLRIGLWIKIAEVLLRMTMRIKWRIRIVDQVCGSGCGDPSRMTSLGEDGLWIRIAEILTG